ncbi:zinc finger protein 675-like [Hoplias malabaricus]|uniref:zinc finger protein 675-like n=1 Tax=Hoplias malabaricus TaxID=27720 RepID=UPI0034627D69
MASTDEMTKLESLHSFFYEKLVAVAGEIFQAVKQAFSEYHEEIYRSKQENVYLRKMLAEAGINDGSDSRQSRAEGVSFQNSKHGALDSGNSVVQVKLELCTTQQDAEPQTPAKYPSSCPYPYGVTAHSQEPPESFSVKAVNTEKEKGDSSPLVSSSRLETCNSLVASSDDSTSASMPSESGPENLSVVIKDEPDSKPYFQCKDVFSDLTPLSSQLQSHAADGLLNCEVCGKPFKNDRLLMAHMVVHQKERPYCCELCGKCYSYAHVLKIHLRTHTGERPYHCRFCGKTFNQKGHVKGHERIHTGEKIYSCSVCGKLFTWLGQGKEHLRIHHDQVATIIRKRKSNC